MLHKVSQNFNKTCRVGQSQSMYLNETRLLPNRSIMIPRKNCSLSEQFSWSYSYSPPAPVAEQTVSRLCKWQTLTEQPSPAREYCTFPRTILKTDRKCMEVTGTRTQLYAVRPPTFHQWPMTCCAQPILNLSLVFLRVLGNGNTLMTEFSMSLMFCL